MNVVCRLLGHKWEALVPPIIEVGEVDAFVGEERRVERVPVTFITDEKCGRPACDAVTTWPT